MNASGTLGYSDEIESLWKVDTLGAYVTKGLSLKPHHEILHRGSLMHAMAW